MRAIARFPGVVLVVLLVLAVGAPATAEPGDQPFVPLPKPGKKIALGADHCFTFSFSRKPAMETIIVKVEITAKDGSKDTSFEVVGDADMPSMKGAHSRGDQPFALSRKGDYLLPITFVMPGDWEVYLTFRKNGAVVFKGFYAFEI